MSQDTVGHDLFTDMATADDATSVASDTEVDASDSNPEPAETAPAPAVETVSEIPAGATSVTDFARQVTQYIMTSKIKSGDELDGSEYVVPQEVYQTVRAQRDQIPHVLVKRAGDDEPRVYILTDLAIPWWMARRERLATRGSGTTRASNRSADDNLTLLNAAVQKHLYATDRAAMWAERVDQASRLVEKYHGFLRDQDVADETRALAVQEATDAYNAEKAAKLAEKAAKGAKPADSANTDEE